MYVHAELFLALPVLSFIMNAQGKRLESPKRKSSSSIVYILMILI